MADALIFTLASVFLVSLIAFMGLLTLSIKSGTLAKILLFMVGMAAGTMLGDAFIHLLPEAVEEAGFTLEVSFAVLIGILIFFMVEKFIHWRHCHIPTSDSHPHPFVYMNLIGDGVHNLLDGIIIAASYMASIPIGIATTIAVLLHEIPQEIGDFGVLLHGGIQRKRALLLNFATALTAVLGALLTFLIGGIFENIEVFLLPFTAGGFIYIAGSDLIPELQKGTACSGFTRNSFFQLMFFVLGIFLMYMLTILE